MSTLRHILRIASQALPAAGIDCLLIGGFAVNYYGYGTPEIYRLVANQSEDENYGTHWNDRRARPVAER